MEQLYEVESYLSPAEAAYIDNPDPEEQECILFGWRYECAGVLLWAAGVVDDLPYPSEIIDVPVLAAIFWQHKGIGGLLSKGFSRSQSEILDAADITLRLGLCGSTSSWKRSSCFAEWGRCHGTALCF